LKTVKTETYSSAVWLPNDPAPFFLAFDGEIEVLQCFDRQGHPILLNHSFTNSRRGLNLRAAFSSQGPLALIALRL
jgi:hypothetical protein